MTLRRPSRRTVLRGVVAAPLIGVAGIGPWPADNAPPEGAEYRAATLARLQGNVPAGQSSPLRAGIAEIDITPPPGHSLAGFIRWTGYETVDTRCFARALTLANGAVTVTILTADLLLINAAMADAVRARAGVRPEEIFFAATHTHSGPGGWGAHPLEWIFAGSYDNAYFERLANQLAEAVRRSRSGLVAAELGSAAIDVPGFQTNRILRGEPTFDRVTALSVRAVGSDRPLCVLAVFGAHATVLRSKALSADYPGALTTELRRSTGAEMAMFAAGAVGDASPMRPPAPTQAESARILGANLAAAIAPAIASSHYEPEPRIGSAHLAVDLAVPRVTVAHDWRLSPLCTFWLANRRTHLHALRLGSAVLVGMPGDYAGHLARRLVANAESAGRTLIPTSFNGDYRGYFTSHEVYDERGCYETRTMNFYGAWSGDYLTEIAQELVARV
jgi:neutral ceramidase